MGKTTQSFLLSSLSNSTLVEGATSIGFFLSTRINQKNVGIPIFRFEYTDPDLDIIQPATDINLQNANLYDNAESYGAGVALWISNSTTWSSAISANVPDLSGFCIPIYRLEQDSSDVPQITFTTPTLVSEMESTGLFVTFNINSSAFGSPLFKYSSMYPFTSAVPASALSAINTNVLLKNPTLDGSDGIGSTNLNPKIRTYANLIRRIKINLGWPMVEPEVCDDMHIVDAIDQAIEWFTKYCGYTEEYLVFNSELYTDPGLKIDDLFTLTFQMRSSRTPGLSSCYDYDMQDYRKVINCFSFDQGETTSINTLFTLEQSMAQMTYFSYILSNVGFDLVTWTILKSWLELREKVLAQKIYFDFDKRNQMLRLIPPPSSKSKYLGVIGAYVEKPVKDIIMERWIYQYALALVKIQIGYIRGKYGNVSLMGGGSLNGNDMLNNGLSEKEKLEKELYESYGECGPGGARFFIG